MEKEQNKKNPLGKWSGGWRLVLLLLIVAFFIAGLGKDLAEVMQGSLWGLTGWHFFSVLAGFGIGVMVAEKYKK